MFKAILEFILVTIGLFVLGTVLVLVDAATSNDTSSPQGFSIAGTVVIVFSPVLSGLWLWVKSRRKKMAHRLAEAQAHRASVREQERSILRRRFLERQRFLDAVDRHRVALTRNLERAVKRNDYGSVVVDKTDDAFAEFFASIDLDASLINENEAKELALEQLDVRIAEDRSVGFDPADLPFDGHAFERWVAEALNGFGWEAEVTAGSGDQGIDVIAKKDGKSVGLQCKLYSSSVGNKAIQEAHAGKVYHKVDAAGVLTNAAFTSSASDLAQATGIHLLSHHDIPKLDEIMFMRGTDRSC